MKNLRLIGTTFALLLVVFSQQVFSKDVSLGAQENSALLKLQEEILSLKRQVEFLNAPIKSEADLNHYLVANPVEKTPLGKLPEIERELFINSLKFTDKGLAGFDYGMLEYGPTATEVHDILELFGLQSFTLAMKNLTVESEKDRAIAERAEAALSLNWEWVEDYTCKSDVDMGGWPIRYCAKQARSMCNSRTCNYP
ncbi:hypothetical protein ACJJJB_12090 [Microbulbifer sp. ANSA001]|uniref:hypothetical protein n=1 Tax=Microbulbifer sp. ANSA001 TaxID=3243358 RepID=UPI00404268A0